ncbi:MAG: NGG1p interacting factor 3 protein [Pseudonocardiales bacterium]|nr:NGG1p interacting factor 3 protein [Pseudonocardiales bacterium]
MGCGRTPTGSVRGVIRLAEVISALDEWYDPRTAEKWDAVGLVCGDPGDPVTSILLAVDPVEQVAAEAERTGAQLIITHHPLLLDAVHSVAATTPKGALLHRLLRGNRGLFVAHTNADAADPGVSDALAARLGIDVDGPLEPLPMPPLDRLGVYVPMADAQRLIDALAAAGAGAIGQYERAAWMSEGEGTFRPLAGASPTVGQIGRIERVAETRIEMAVPRHRRAAVLAALHSAHPYEAPAFDLVEQAAQPSALGIGRIGRLRASMTLAEFAAHAAARLPATVWGVRASGNPDAVISRVAVCGGAGGSLIEVARAAGADAYLTSDLRHHSVGDAMAVLPGTGEPRTPMALLDAAHWATESPWLDGLGDRLRSRFGTTLSVHVSQINTDPWTVHSPSRRSAG